MRPIHRGWNSMALRWLWRCDLQIFEFFLADIARQERYLRTAATPTRLGNGRLFVSALGCRSASFPSNGNFGHDVIRASFNLCDEVIRGAGNLRKGREWLCYRCDKVDPLSQTRRSRKM